MSTETITIVLVGIFALGFAAVAFLLYRAKSQADESHRNEISKLQSQLADASKAVGRADELQNSLKSAQDAKEDLEKRLRDAAKDINELTDQLSSAKTAKQNAEDHARQAIEAEKDNSKLALEREKQSCNDLIAKEKESCAEIIKAKDKELEAKDSQIKNLDQFIERANETLKDSFKSLSQDTLSDVGKQFEKAAKVVIDQNSETTTQNVKLHKEQIEKMLQPVGLTLDQLDKQIKDTNEKRTKAETDIQAVIRESANTNRQLSEALRKPVMRGTYGEVKLQTLLKACGLTEGEDYELQVPVFGDDDQGRVDALVDMAQGKKLVIDSKNLLEPFVEYANAETPEESAELLKEFQKKCRETLRSLSLKQYAEKVNTIDAVLMFLPDEGMYYAALESDRQLIAKMTEQRVYVVSPTSLLPILKSVAYILGLERQNRDTQAVVDAGRILYSSLRELMDDLRVLGTNLDRSTKNYNDVVKRFETQLVPRSRRLQKMRVNRGKALPELAEVSSEVRHLAASTVSELGAIPVLPSMVDDFDDDSVFDETADETN